jgi:hypothetical protein
MAKQALHPWSAEALLAKSQMYFEEMLKHSRDEWQFAHWSSLAMELLARAALSKISPTLLADTKGPDNKSWDNTYFALGHTPLTPKFSPVSIGIKEVLSRLQTILPAFTPDMEKSASTHMGRRNEELHSGGSPFTGLNSTSWLPGVYEACTTLAESLGKDLAFLVGEDEATTAKKLIDTARDKSAAAVKGSVEAHKKVWENKAQGDRDRLAEQASVWAKPNSGHRVKCPACESDALVYGHPTAEPLKSIQGDEITERQEHLPSQFECVACGLKISNYAQLAVCGLGEPYTSTSVYDAAEYYSDAMRQYEDDNNENW